MSRRRKPRKPASTTAPNHGTKWGHLSDAELYAEMARRLVAKGVNSLEDIELAAEDAAHVTSEEIQEQTPASLPPEDGKPKPCPKCGALVPVKARNRTRHFLTIAGELRLSRNYHSCEACKRGFYPRDAELKLPEEGEVSGAMERRILDFGVNASFAEVAQRWGNLILHPRGFGLRKMQLLPKAIQILDWYHSVKHAVDCGKVLLGEDSPWLPLWQQRAEALLAAGEPDAFIAELMSCMALLPNRGRAESLTALDDLIRYYRTNRHRMRYAAFRTAGPLDFYEAIQRARARDKATVHYWRRGHFRYAREGTRERSRCLRASSN